MPRILRAVLLAAVAALAFASPASAALVINEIDYDQPSNDTAEYLELANTGEAPVNLDPYSLEFINGANGGAADYRTTDLPAVSLDAGGYYVVCADPATVPACDLDIGNNDLIQNGAPDAVALTQGGVIADTVSYEGAVPGFTEGTAGAGTDPALADESLSRVPDGADTNQNAADFQVVSGTPGAANPGGGTTDTAPSVASSEPGAGATNVDRDANLSVTFSEPVTADDSAFSLRCADADVALTVTRVNETT
jgi:hypothetical protein